MTKLFLGLLSGTSMDAIDVAALDFSQQAPKIIATHSVDLPSNFKKTCLKIINSGYCEIAELGMLDRWAGELFADAVNQFLGKTNLSAADITAIGSHGQTIWHAPDLAKPFTWQIGDPNVIAVKTGITTVADFRRADMAAGGQGAPLAPAFHQAVLASADEARCILNIGGISNISVLINNTCVGFDTGPGNCLLDLWVKNKFDLEYDANGEIAQSGKVSEQLLKLCLADPYFKVPYPKSTGREYFNQPWLEQKINQINDSKITPADVLRTLVQLTATSIAAAINTVTNNKPAVYVYGGGAKNACLIAALNTELNTPVHTTDKLGIAPEWMETAIFAWLAQQTMSGVAVDLRSITGSQRPVVLGGIFKGQ